MPTVTLCCALVLLAQVAAPAPAQAGPWWTAANTLLTGVVAAVVQRWRARFTRIEKKLADCEADRSKLRGDQAARDGLEARVKALEERLKPGGNP